VTEKVSDNLRRTDGECGVYEVWYLTWNHPETDQGFWLRYTTETPTQGAPRGELWFARFDPRRPERTFGIHKHFGGVQDASDPFALTIGGSRLGDDHALGRLDGGGHAVRWDLRWRPSDRVMRLLPDLMYGGGGRGETTVLSPNPRVALSGTLEIDGEVLSFDRAVMGQTHLWGRRHAYSWTWGRCAEFEGAPDALIELLGVRLQRRGIVLPPLVLVTLELDGEQHRLNQFRHVVRNRGKWQGSDISFSAWSPAVRVEGEMSCRPGDMVVAPYLDPDGTRVYCSNTEIGNAHITLYRRSGVRWREQRTLVATHRAHFEIGGRTRDPAVVRDHVLV
jgi:hypothetical protein